MGSNKRDAELDPLAFEILTVAGMPFRVYSNTGRADSGSRSETAQPSRHFDDDEGGDESETADVQRDSSGRWTATVQADSCMYGVIIGKGGSGLRELKDATGCTVAVPSKDSGRDDIRITGPSAASVSSALTRIELLLERALSGPAVPYTHFVSLPLNAPAVCAAVDAFKAEVLATALPEEGLGEDIFPPSAQIHLTLVMLKLAMEPLRQQAKEVMARLSEEFADEPPLRLRVKGLRYMNDDPSAVDVLYACVGEVGSSGRLEKIGAAVVKAFSEEGLLLEKDDKPVKWHATLINTRFRKEDEAAEKERQEQAAGDATAGGRGGGGRGGGRGGRGGAPFGRAGGAERVPFDARRILRDFGTRDFGEITVKAAHLSQRGKFGPDKFYHCVVQAPFEGVAQR